MSGRTTWLLGDATYEDFRDVKIFSALDGLRAISVLAVIWHHTSGQPGGGFFSKGAYGVDFFFAISGFLITTLLLRERQRTGRVSLSGFYVRRFFRIVPIYYLVLLVYIALTFATRRDTAEGQQFLRNLPAFLTYTSNWFVDRSRGESVTFYFAWSLATEEQFYLFWPPLMVAIFALTATRASWSAPTMISCVGALVVISQAANSGSEDSIFIRILASLALPILLGAAAAIALNDRIMFRWLSPILSATWCAPLVFTVMISSLIIDTPPQLTQILMAIAVMSVCATENTLIHPVLRWRPLAYVGTISYGIYLMHMLCANFLRYLLPERFGIALFLFTTLLVIAVASVSFRYFEFPLQARGKAISARLTTRARTEPKRPRLAEH